MRRVFSVIVATVVSWVMLTGSAFADSVWAPGEAVENIVLDNVKPLWKVFVVVGTLVVLSAFRRPMIMGSFFGIMVLSGIMIWGIDDIANQMNGLADRVNSAR